MLEAIWNKEDILTTLRGVTDADPSSEQLFDLMLDFFVAFKVCADAFSQQVGCA